MSRIREARTRRYIGHVQTILLYRDTSGMAERMMEVRIPEELESGKFLFDGKNVHFHEDDEKFKKFIAYESFEQVQRTVGKSKTVRLRP